MGKAESKPMVDQTPRVKIVLMGSPKVGKTSLAVYLEKGHFLTEGDGTPECQLFQFQDTCHGFKVKGIVMDSLSDRDLETKIPCRLRCIRNADCAMIIFDYSQLRSFETLREKLQALSVNEYRSKAIVLVGNKADNEVKLIDDEEVEKLIGEQHGLQMRFFKTSCKDGSNVREAFTEAVTIGFTGYRMAWEIRKPVVWVYDQAIHPETQMQVKGRLSFGAGLCESLPNMFRKGSNAKLPKLDQLPMNVMVEVLKHLF